MLTLHWYGFHWSVIIKWQLVRTLKEKGKNNTLVTVEHFLWNNYLFNIYCYNVNNLNKFSLSTTFQPFHRQTTWKVRSTTHVSPLKTWKNPEFKVLLRHIVVFEYPGSTLKDSMLLKFPFGKFLETIQFAPLFGPQSK